MFTHHVNLLHTTYRYDPVHEDIVTHIRHRLLLCQHVGDVAKDDEKNREDCSSDNCKHLVDVNFTKSYHLYTRHQKHQKLSSQQDIFCGIDIFERKPSRLDSMLTHTSYWRKNNPKLYMWRKMTNMRYMLTTPKKRRSVSVLSRNLYSSANPT